MQVHYNKFKEDGQLSLNLVFAHYHFNNETQGTDSIDKFFTHLRLRAEDCRYVPFCIGPEKKSFMFKIGSAVNIISCQIYAHFGLSYGMQPPDSKLTSYSGDHIKVNGKVKLQCAYKCSSIGAMFYLVGTSTRPLIGLQSSLDLDLLHSTYSVDKLPTGTLGPLNKHSVMSNYEELFKGIGKLPENIELHQIKVREIFHCFHNMLPITPVYNGYIVNDIFCTPYCIYPLPPHPFRAL